MSGTSRFVEHIMLLLDQPDIRLVWAALEARGDGWLYTGFASHPDDVAGDDDVDSRAGRRRNLQELQHRGGAADLISENHQHLMDNFLFLLGHRSSMHARVYSAELLRDEHDFDVTTLIVQHFIALLLTDRDGHMRSAASARLVVSSEFPVRVPRNDHDPYTYELNRHALLWSAFQVLADCHYGPSVLAPVHGALPDWVEKRYETYLARFYKVYPPDDDFGFMVHLTSETSSLVQQYFAGGLRPPCPPHNRE
jgi:hypothetical protein